MEVDISCSVQVEVTMAAQHRPIERIDAVCFQTPRSPMPCLEVPVQVCPSAEFGCGYARFLEQSPPVETQHSAALVRALVEYP